MKYILYIFLLLFTSLPAIGQQFYNGVPTTLPYIQNPTNVSSAPFITSGTRSDTMVVTGSSLGSSYFGGTLRGQDSLHPFVVYYNNTNGAGIGIEGVKYMKVIGIGTATINGGGTNGYVKAKADYVQVSGFKNLNGTNGSWWLKLESGEACNYSPVTDYLNGLASNTVITNRLMHIWFTHNQIGNTDGTNSCGGEGVYAISTGAYGRDPVPCLSNTIYKPLWGGFFHIDSNYIYNVGRTGIQLSGCDTGFNTMVGNHIFNAGRELNSTQGAGIRTGYGTNNTTYIANNEVRNSYIYNYDLETGAIFENNVGDSAGFWKQTQNPQGVPSVIASAALANSTVIIKGNTMGVNTASPSTGIAIYGGSNYTNDNIVCNNTTNVRILSTPFNYSTDCGITPTPPTANAGNDTTVTLPATINLNGSYTQGTGTVTSTIWSNSDGCTISNANSLNTTASCPSGIHTFTFIVEDDNLLSDTASKMVTVNPAPPAPIRKIIIKYLKIGSAYLKLKHTDSSNITNFGIFVDGSGDYNTLALQLHRAKELEIPVFRYNYTYGSTYRLQQCKDSISKVQLTFNYNQINNNNGYASDPVAFKDALRTTLLSVSEKPDFICIRNEPQNKSYWDTANPINYVNNELKPAAELCDSLGIPMSDGGFLPGTVFTLWKYYEDNNITDSLTWLEDKLAPYGITGINNSIAQAYINWNSVVLEGISGIPELHYINQHGNEPWGTDTSITTTTGIFPVVMNHIASVTGKKVWSNEFHTSNYSTILLKGFINDILKTDPDLLIYFAGDTYGTGGNSIDLSEDYSNYIRQLK